MNKNVISVILIIIGGYFLIGNTIFSLLFNHIGPSYGVPVSSEDYWSNWWANYGLSTIIIAVLGIILILIGFNIKRKINSDKS
jgi:hypothetical protein